jgi:hypothetical protein
MSEDNDWDLVAPKNMHLKEVLDSVGACVKKTIKPEDYISLCTTVTNKLVELEKYRIDKECETKILIKEKELEVQSRNTEKLAVCQQDVLQVNSMRSELSRVTEAIENINIKLKFFELTKKSPIQTILEKTVGNCYNRNPV